MSIKTKTINTIVKPSLLAGILDFDKLIVSNELNNQIHTVVLEKLSNPAWFDLENQIFLDPNFSVQNYMKKTFNVNARFQNNVVVQRNTVGQAAAVDNQNNGNQNGNENETDDEEDYDLNELMANR